MKLFKPSVFKSMNCKTLVKLRDAKTQKYHLGPKFFLAAASVTCGHRVVQAADNANIPDCRNHGIRNPWKSGNPGNQVRRKSSDDVAS